MFPRGILTQRRFAQATLDKCQHVAIILALKPSFLEGLHQRRLKVRHADYLAIGSDVALDESFSRSLSIRFTESLNGFMRQLGNGLGLVATHYCYSLNSAW
jgi:hypothetical protein